MKTTLAYTFAGALLLAALAAGWQLRGCTQTEGSVRPRASVETDTSNAGRPIAAEDTATTTDGGADADVAGSSTPGELIRYETVTDTVRDCYARPLDLDVRGLAGPRPVRVDPGGLFSSTSVTLTTFDPAASRFEQRVYDVPRPDWELYPYAEAGYGPLGFRAGGGAGLRWKRLELHAGYRLAEGGRRGVAVGLRVRPFTLDW